MVREVVLGQVVSCIETGVYERTPDSWRKGLFTYNAVQVCGLQLLLGRCVVMVNWWEFRLQFAVIQGWRPVLHLSKLVPDFFISFLG